MEIDTTIPRRVERMVIEVETEHDSFGSTYKIKISDHKFPEFQKILLNGAREDLLINFVFKEDENIGQHEEREKIKRNIGQLRQYLNEKTDTNLITNKELEEFLLNNK